MKERREGGGNLEADHEVAEGIGVDHDLDGVIRQP